MAHVKFGVELVGGDSRALYAANGFMVFLFFWGLKSIN